MLEGHWNIDDPNAPPRLQGVRVQLSQDQLNLEIYATVPFELTDTEFDYIQARLPRFESVFKRHPQLMLPAPYTINDIPQLYSQSPAPATTSGSQAKVPPG